MQDKSAGSEAQSGAGKEALLWSLPQVENTSSSTKLIQEGQSHAAWESALALWPPRPRDRTFFMPFANTKSSPLYRRLTVTQTIFVGTSSNLWFCLWKLFNMKKALVLNESRGNSCFFSPQDSGASERVFASYLISYNHFMRWLCQLSGLLTQTCPLSPQIITVTERWSIHCRLLWGEHVMETG